MVIYQRNIINNQIIFFRETHVKKNQKEKNFDFRKEIVTLAFFFVKVDLNTDSPYHKKAKFSGILA